MSDEVLILQRKVLRLRHKLTELNAPPKPKKEKYSYKLPDDQTQKDCAALLKWMGGGQFKTIDQIINYMTKILPVAKLDGRYDKGSKTDFIIAIVDDLVVKGTVDKVYNGYSYVYCLSGAA